MEIFRIFGSVFLKSDEADNRLDRINKKGKKSGEMFSKLGKGAMLAGGVIATGIGAGATALLSLTNSLADTSSEILKFSQITGHTTDEYQRWDGVMKQFGFSMEQASGDLAALGEKAMDASMGAGEGAELFGKLGVSVTDVGGQLLSQEEIFAKTITALQDMENVTERNAIASALLSTTGEELVPVLNMTAEELENVKSKTNIISLEDLQKAEEYKIKVQDMQNKFKALGQELAIKFLPVAEKLFAWFEKAMPFIEVAVNKTFEIVDMAIQSTIKWFKRLKRDSSGIINFIVDDVLPLLTDYFNFIKDELIPALVETFLEWWPKISDIVQDVWGLIKIVLDKLVKDFKIVWPLIKDIVMKAVEKIKGLISGLLTIIKGAIQIITGLATGDWKKAWEGFKNIFNGVIQVIKTTFSEVIDWIAKKVEWIMQKVEKAKELASRARNIVVGGAKAVVGGARNLVGLAEGGTIQRAGSVLVGERGPEILSLPRSAQVTPLDKTRGMINLTVNNPMFLDETGADMIMDKTVDRLRMLGVT